MNNVYSDAQLARFGKVVRMLSYDHYPEDADSKQMDEAIEDYFSPEHHGSGSIVLYKNKLFFICTRHSFHCDGLISHPLIESYDSLCFLKDGGELYKPAWTQVHFDCKSIEDNERQLAMEDMLIYEFNDSDNDNYTIFKSHASVLDFNETLKCLTNNQNIGYAVGYSNIPGGNTDYEKKMVKQHLSGRYTLIYKLIDVDGYGSAKIDTSGLSDEGIGISGMSGGAILTINDNGVPYFVGMIEAGSVASQKVHFLSSLYIEIVLSSYLE